MLDAHAFERLADVGLAQWVAKALVSMPPLPVAEPQLLRLVEVHRDSLVLHDGQAELSGRAHPRLIAELLASNDALAVGDWVLADLTQPCWVHARVPPRTQLARRLHDGREKVTRVVIVSNVDTALLVMGLDHDFNLRRLERFLAFVSLAEIESLVVLTKADLCADAEQRLLQAQAILPAGSAALALDATCDASRERLLPWLRKGRTLALLGSSGAGKSTLTNLLTMTRSQDTGGLRKGDGRGRHTTTSRSMHRTPEGACIIDTPGLRTLRLDTAPEAVGSVFDDIAQLAPACRFRDCRHHEEPGCAVRGAVDPLRLDNYRKLLREARRDQMSALERKAEVAVWKVRSRHARMVTRAKRG